MELRHLRYFVAVAEEQNVTRAARLLHLAQPSLSRQVRDLEQELGIDLFEHRAKSLSLTEAGRVFLREARAVLQRADEAVQRARAAASGLRGEIHIGYAPSLTLEILPGILKAFQAEHPDVRVHLHDLSTQEMVRGLRAGRLQAALLVRMSRQDWTDLTFEALQSHPVGVAMHPAHALAGRARIRLEDLARERLVAFSAADYPEYHAWLAALFAPLGQAPRIIEEHDSFTSLIAAVEVGCGVALVSQHLDRLAGLRLKTQPLRPAPPPLVVGIAYGPAEPQGLSARFIRAARELREPAPVPKAKRGPGR